MHSALWTVSTFILPLFFAIILHELAHGFVALKMGDNTAKMAGRLTLNPIHHIDPVGSILVPTLLFLTGSGVMFGWAKPVPVNFHALRDEKHDMGLVALAGPVTNFLLAIVSVLLMVAWQSFVPVSPVGQWFFDMFQAFFMINIALCAFNLLPILPLDGGRILASILPNKLASEYAQTEKYGFYILLGILFILPLMGVDFLRAYMRWMTSGLTDLIAFFM